MLTGIPTHGENFFHLLPSFRASYVLCTLFLIFNESSFLCQLKPNCSLLQILPSILFVKANNAESCESKRFQSLAFADLSATMGKKKLKAFIPQLVQAIYFGVLFTFCAGTLVVSKSSFDCSAMVSFVTSLVLLISPIQVMASFIGRIMFLYFQSILNCLLSLE